MMDSKQIEIEGMKELLKENELEIGEKMDYITSYYDRLLKEIDDLVCKIKKHERENSSN